MWQILTAGREKAVVAKAAKGLCSRRMSPISPDKVPSTPIIGCGLLSVGESWELGVGHDVLSWEKSVFFWKN